MTTWRLWGRAGLMAVVLAPLPALACELPAGWTSMKAEADAATRVAILQPDVAVQVGQPFAIDVAVCTTGAVETIKVDASMPRHRHGMNYKPKVVRTSGNKFRADTLLFHMPGLWRITVKTYQAGKPAHFSLDMTVE